MRFRGRRPISTLLILALAGSVRRSAATFTFMKLARLALVAASLLVVALPLAASPPGGDETPFLLDDDRAPDDCGLPFTGPPVVAGPGVIGRIDPIENPVGPDDVRGQLFSPRSPPR